MGTSILKVPTFKQRALKLVEGTEGGKKTQTLQRHFPLVFLQSVVSFSNFQAQLMLQAFPMKVGSLLFPKVGYSAGMLLQENPPPPAEMRKFVSLSEI